MPKEGLEQAAPAAGTGRTGSELVDTVMLQGACSLPSFLVPFLFHLMKLFPRRGLTRDLRHRCRRAGRLGVAGRAGERPGRAAAGGGGRGPAGREGGLWPRGTGDRAAAAPRGEQPGRGAAVRGGGPTMPKVFLVKRRSPGVSVRSWDELPDEERADTYIPGERRAGAGPGRRVPGVRARVAGSPLLYGRGCTVPLPHVPLSRGGGSHGGAGGPRVRGWEPGTPCAPFPLVGASNCPAAGPLAAARAGVAREGG